MSDNERKTFIKLTMALYVLKILHAGGPNHGNKMAEEIRQRTGRVIDPNPNGLYPLLHYLEEHGYIIGQWDSPAKRGKRIYHITPAGSDYIPVLAAKLASRMQEIEHNIRVLRADLML